MPRRQLWTLAIAAACLLGGCATPTKDEIAARGADVKVYRVNEPIRNRVEIVSHLWAESWQTSFSPPTHATADDAIASLRAEAARLGADALVNVVCFDQGRPKWSGSTEPAILCYANAVRVRPGAG